MSESLHPVIDGNLQAIGQLLQLLEKVSPEQYRFAEQGLTQSSLGVHCRHILDIYQALICALESDNCVDYDTRRRGSSLETDPQAARTAFVTVQKWLKSLSDSQLHQHLSVQSEVSLASTCTVRVASNLLRELVFASSHFVHHLAIIGILARLQKIDASQFLGIAPATASFLRQQASKQANH